LTPALQGRGVTDQAPLPARDGAPGEHEIPALCFGTNRLHVLEDHGHLDLLVGASAVENVFEPVLAWLESGAPEPAP